MEVPCEAPLQCVVLYQLSLCSSIFLREDFLGQILTMSNVHAGSNMVLMETCQGFLAGALLERMGGRLTAIFLQLSLEH